MSRRFTIIAVLALVGLAGTRGAVAQEPTRSLVLTVHGAARQVGGSCFMLDADGQKVLLDCGLGYGPEGEGGSESRFAFQPSAVRAVILSHIHMDHAGRIPLLMRQGFTGPIHATRVTRDLARIMMGSAFRYGDFGTERFYASTRSKTVHSRADCRSGSRIRSRREISAHRPGLEKQGLRMCRTCTALEADEVVARFVIHRYHEEFEVTPRMRATFQATGHLPGSAMTVVRTRNASGSFRVAWSGDYGGGDHPFLNPPELLAEAQVLLMESTYGDRPQATPSPARSFIDVVARALRRGDRVLIPSFVLDRTQKVMAALGQGMQDGRLPRAPVLVTSPSAEEVSQAYLGFSHDRATYGEAFCAGFFKSPFHGLSWERRSLRESSEVGRPSVVIASSADGRYGAVHDLLPEYAADPKATIVTVGWSSSTSPVGLVKEAARRGQASVSLERVVPLRAHVETASLSSHGSGSVLARLASRCRGLRTLFLVHGESQGLQTFSAYLRKLLPAGVHIQVPGAGTRYRLY